VQKYTIYNTYHERYSHLTIINALADTNDYLKKLYHLTIIQFGNMKYFHTDNITFSKNKMSIHTVDLPLEFRWRNSTPDSHKFWRVHLGVKLSYLIYDQYKLESSQGNVRQTNLKDFNDFQYGIYLTTGWNTWNLYAYYGLNPLFKSSAKIEGQSIDMNTANFGLMFYIL
jgi:hypothetical protein